MKNLLILLLSIPTLCAYGQRFVKVKTPKTKSEIGQIVAREGHPRTYAVENGSQIAIDAALTMNDYDATALGKRFWIREIRLSANQNVKIELQANRTADFGVGGSQNTNYNLLTFFERVRKGETVTIPIEDFLFKGAAIWALVREINVDESITVTPMYWTGTLATSTAVFSNSGKTVAIADGTYTIANANVGTGIASGDGRKVTVASGLVTAIVNTLKISITCVGFEIADDTNFDADYVLMGIGDSITNGTGVTAASGTSSTETMWPFQIRDYLRSSKYNFRYVTKAVGGQTSAQTKMASYWGWLDVPRCDLALYNLGTNDAATTFTASDTATYKANIRAVVKRLLLNYQCPVVVLGITPSQDTNRETRNVLARTAAQALVAEFSTVTRNGKPLVRYLNLGDSFTATDATKYNGDGIHPNDAGNLLIGTNAITKLAAIGLTNLLPVIKPAY